MYHLGFAAARRLNTSTQCEDMPGSLKGQCDSFADSFESRRGVSITAASPEFQPQRRDWSNVPWSQSRVCCADAERASGLEYYWDHLQSDLGEYLPIDVEENFVLADLSDDQDRPAFILNPRLKLNRVQIVLSYRFGTWTM